MQMWGADLTHYDVDIASAELIKRETVTLLAGAQYAWPHASRRYLYVAPARFRLWQGRDRAPRHAFSIDPATGAHPDTAADAPYPHQHGHSV